MQALLETDVQYLLEHALEQCPEQLPSSMPLLFEFPLSEIALLPWLKAQRSVPQFYWRSRDKEQECAGIGIAKQFEAQDAQQLAEAEAALRSFLCEHPQGHLLRCFFGMAFNTEQPLSGSWQGFPVFFATIPELLLHRDAERYTAIVCVMPKAGDSREQVIRRAFRTLEKSFHKTAEIAGLAVKGKRVPEEREAWLARCRAVLAAIDAGRYEKLVLARNVQLELDTTPHPVDLAAALQDSLGEGYTFVYTPQRNTSFICQTPECLFTFDGQRCTADALGGSTLHAAAELMAGSDAPSRKLQREHEYVVRDLQEKFADLSGNGIERLETEVVRLPYISHIRTKITAKVAPHVDALFALKRLHPTPAVGTYPSSRACPEIAAVEDFERGWYSGAVGVLGQGEAEVAVALRGVLVQERHAVLCGGAGLVAGSEAELEWQEIESKLAPLLSVFSVS